MNDNAKLFNEQRIRIRELERENEALRRGNGMLKVALGEILIESGRRAIRLDPVPMINDYGHRARPDLGMDVERDGTILLTLRLLED